LPGIVTEKEAEPGWSTEGRIMPYTVPAGYFEQLPAAILKQVAPAKAKVISMGARKWMPYAVAAVFIGLLVLGSILYRGNDSATGGATNPEEWVAKQLRNVSNEELEDFILATSVNEGERVQQTAGNQREVQKLLRDVPNSELDAFLSQLPVGNEQIN
jgi:hypothetical protein